MPSYNHVTLVGNLTRDPEARTLPNGDTVCDLGMAVTERFMTKAGETRELTTFVDVSTWGAQARACAEHLKKGRCVLVDGKLVSDTWEDKETGKKRTRVRVKANMVQFITPPAGVAAPQHGGGTFTSGSTSAPAQ